LETHGCKDGKITDAAYTSRRLISLGTDLEGGDVRLVENIPPGVRYTALNYCWRPDLGGVVRITEHKKASHMEGIT